jgi:hypothetical protein
MLLVQAQLLESKLLACHAFNNNRSDAVSLGCAKVVKAIARSATVIDGQQASSATTALEEIAA